MYNRNNNRGGREVCRFFLEGRCKFGDNCKNEHPSNGGGQSNGNRFAPLQNPSAGNARGRAGAVSGIGGQQAPQTYGITADGIRLDLTENSQKGERPQWEFSSYAPGVGAPRQLLEGPLEQSEEEMRVMCYLANATGQLQAYDQHVNGMRNEMTQQIQRILNDTEGAKRYVQEGEHQHPNRIDQVVKASGDFPWVNKPGNSQPQQATTFGQANGASSGFGQQQQPAASGFGQASNLGGAASGFGQASALGGGGASAFGQASNLGVAKPAFGQPAFGQPSQPAGGAFGQPSQPAGSAFGQSSQPAAPAFGQPSQPVAPAFGQPSQPGASTFGQPSQPAAPAFGQPSQPAGNAFGQNPQPATNAFGQPSQPAASNPFGQPSQPAATNAFGQPSQPAASNPFGQNAQQAPAQSTFGKPSPFGGAAPAAPAFGAPAFGQQQQSQSTFGQSSQPTSTFGQSSQPTSTFGQSSQPTSTFGQSSQPTSGFGGAPAQAPPASGFGGASSQPPAASGFGAQSTGGATGNGLFQGQRIYKHPKNGHPMVKLRNQNGVERETRVWNPDGPPTIAAPDTEGLPEAYERDMQGVLKEFYEELRVKGEFPMNFMPEIPPRREWVGFDL